MLKPLALATLATLTLTGCSAMLPSQQTEGPWAGRCYQVTYVPVLDMGIYTAAEMIDGWKCFGRAEGEPIRTDTRAEAVAEQRASIKTALDGRLKRDAERKAVPAAVVPASAPAAVSEPTWSTGE